MPAAAPGDRLEPAFALDCAAEVAVLEDADVLEGVAVLEGAGWYLDVSLTVNLATSGLSHPVHM